MHVVHRTSVFLFEDRIGIYELIKNTFGISIKGLATTAIIKPKDPKMKSGGIEAEVKSMASKGSCDIDSTIDYSITKIMINIDMRI